MLPPTKDLADLSLGTDMPRRSKRVSKRQSGDTQEEAGGSSSATDIIQAASGLSYIVNEPSDKSRLRAVVGLHNVDVKLRQAIPQTEDGGSYFAFEFTDQFSIRVGASDSAHATPSCTCGANEDGAPCKHLYWFVDQVVSASPPDGVISVSADLSTVRDLSLMELIHRLGFQTLVDKLPKAENAPDPPSAPGELGTIRQLRKEVSAAFQAFDNWILYDHQGEEQALDVAACAFRLEELVAAIREACTTPQWDVTDEAIATLLEIANGVVSRNRDAHKIANAAWGLDQTSAPHADQDNNLYTCLMRHNPVNEGGSLFAALNEIGHDVLFLHEVEIKLLIQQVLTLGLAPLHRGEVDRLSDRLVRGRKRAAEGFDRGSSSRGRARH